MSDTWRTGRSVGRTIYLNDKLVGLMDTPELAERVVHALGASPQIDSADIEVTVYRHRFQDMYEAAAGVQMKHIPTGLSTACATERSALANKIQCFKELREAIALGVPADEKKAQS